jgi:hypothetical protein
MSAESIGAALERAFAAADVSRGRLDLRTSGEVPDGRNIGARVEQVLDEGLAAIVRTELCDARGRRRSVHKKALPIRDGRAGRIAHSGHKIDLEYALRGDRTPDLFLRREAL